MEKIPIRVVVDCPKFFYREQTIEWCYTCDYFKGMEYIDDGFKNVTCSYNLLEDGEGEEK